MKNGDVHFLAIPIMKTKNPLDAFEPEDLEALERAIPVCDKMIGAIAAHEDCDDHKCGVYDREMIDKMLFTRERLSDIAAALRAYHGMPESDSDSATIASGEDAIRQTGRKLGVPDDVIEQTIEKLDLGTQIAVAKQAMAAANNTGSPTPTPQFFGKVTDRKFDA